MSFAIPAALFLTTLAFPILALYVLKVRFRRVPVSSNLFWKQVCEEKPPRAMWHQLRHWMSLLLQLLLLSLIVLAAADPVLNATFTDARRIVLIVDNSASMRVADAEPTRLDAAKAAALKFVEGLRFQDQMAVLAGSSHPEIHTGFTSDVRKLRDAVEKISATDNPTRLSDAVALAHRMLSAQEHAQENEKILVLTDGCLTDSDLVDSGLFPDVTQQSFVGSESADDLQRAATAEADSAAVPGVPGVAASASAASAGSAPVQRQKAPVECQLFGTDSANVGITRLQARRSLSDPLGYEILTVVRNASAIPLTCRIELFLNEVPIDVIPLRLGSEEVWNRSVSGLSAEGGVVTAKLTQVLADDRQPSESQSEEGDSPALSSSRNKPGNDEMSALSLNWLTTDDQAWTILPDRTRVKVLIISPDNLFLQKAFEAGGLADVSVRRDFPETWPSDTVIVFYGAVPRQLPSGPVMVISPRSDCDLWQVGEELDNPVVAEQNSESPLMTHVQLGSVQVRRSGRLKFLRDPFPLVSTAEGDTLYAVVPRSEGKCLVLSVDLAESDLAFRTTFPVLITNALTWFGGKSGDLQPVFRTGATGSLPLLSSVSAAESIDASGGNRNRKPWPQSAIEDGDGASELLLESPHGDLQPVRGPQDDLSASSLVRLGPLDKVGLWRLFSAKNSPSYAVGKASNSPLAVVAVNLANDQETDVRPAKALTESDLSAARSSWGVSRPLWFFLALVASVLMTAEWVLYQRRVIS